MDIFAHGLWAGAGAKAINKAQDKRRVNVWAMVLWGMFPDLFAFTIPFLYLIWSLVFNPGAVPHLGHSPIEPVGAGSSFTFALASHLYNVSHSLIIFAIVFFGVWAYFKQARLELLGWLLHILMDIPTHTYAFFPTPAFWPLVDWKFSGISWGQPWFMVLNYSCLLLAYALLARKKRV